MSLWMVMTLALVAVAAPLAWLAWRPGRADSGSSDTVYADQLAEIDREESAGLIDEADARMARLEVQRRLIAAGDAGHLEVTEMNTTDRITLVATIAVIAIGSAVVYATVGSPGTASHPMGSTSRQVMAADLGTLDTADPAPVPSAQDPAGNLPSVDEMIVRLEERLADNPGDAEGWRMLGWSRFKTGDPAGAAAAYRQALELEPDDARIQSVYGESLILAGGGFVSAEAEQALGKAVELDPSDARARFLLGLKKQQDGDIEGSLEDWITLLNEAPADADWYEDVRARTRELAISTGIDVTGRLPPPRTGPPQAAAQPASTAAAPAPTQQQVDAASEMSPEDRQAMISGMVERLETRLQSEPEDLDGWERLIRSRLVLRQPDMARQAHQQASGHFAGNQSALARLDAALETQP